MRLSDEDIAPLTNALPERAKEADGPVFSEPWEAEAFALTITLHQKGVFTWQEWADALSAAIATDKTAGGNNDGSNYYELWLEALEMITEQKGIIDTNELYETKAAWRAAYLATPHGHAVTLKT